MAEQLDLLAALDARDAALERVSHNAGETWMQEGVRRIGLLRSWQGTAEDLRILLLDSGFEAPHHHNAWGALTRMALSHGLLVRTGAFTHMRTRKSHARMTAVYRSRF
jgi:hypothetical protein